MSNRDRDKLGFENAAASGGRPGRGGWWRRVVPPACMAAALGLTGLMKHEIESTAAAGRADERPAGQAIGHAGQAAMPAALAWAVEFLRDHFTDEPCDFHAELMGDLANPRRRLLARVAPRGHAKSTCAALAYPLWCICEGRKRNIIIVTHEASLATQFVRDIRGELESNERILEAYGDLCVGEEGTEARRHEGTKGTRPSARGLAGTEARSTGPESGSPIPDLRSPIPAARRRRGKWTEAMFTTHTGVTVQAKGSGASLRGVRVGANRPDLIICDDIEKDDLVASAENRRKLEHWLRRVVMPALSPDGQLLVLGSIIHYDSLLANLRDRQAWPRWDYKVYRAFEAETAADGTHTKTSLWPARWPVERLEVERERVGTLAFEQEYQANPIDDSIRVFRPEWLRRSDVDKLNPRDLVWLIAVDPATGKEAGDYFAMWVGCVDTNDGTIHTKRLTLERINIVEQIKRIVDAFVEFKPVRIGIETQAYQAALKDILDDHSRRERLYMPIVGIDALRNKIARVQGSAAFYENGTFHLPPTLDPVAESQFLHFPKTQHDDAPDVCAMAIELARTLRGGLKVEGASLARNPYARRGGW